MIYTPFSLNGDWEMAYEEENYTSCEQPSFCGEVVRSAIPAYWEDMTDRFCYTKFYRRLRINPKYGILRYPILHYCPDMALPNIVGNFFYKRKFFCEGVISNATLHFGGVQNAVSVWLNGEFLGRHEGCNTSFDMDIPDSLVKNGENEIVLSVSNHHLEGFDGKMVWGLTLRAACEYSGGVWGDIELRVYKTPLRSASVIISEDCSIASVKTEETQSAEFEWSVLDGEKIIKSGSANGDFSFATDGMELWSPENPRLYTLRINCGGACLEKRFGVRRLTVDGFSVLLNGKKYYLRGVCEHCYYPETVNPTSDISYYRMVIKKFKELGFNFIRFHTHVPREEYMQAADELGMLVQVECPEHGTFDEWCDIVRVCREHTSTVIYCCGNEVQLYDNLIEHLRKCADVVHKNTDSLFSPMSALRGLEYSLEAEPEHFDELKETPFRHNPRKFEVTREFSDLYNSFAQSEHSYGSIWCDIQKVESWRDVYKRPRLSHEIGIDGTYADLSLKDRYKGTRIEMSGMFDSIEKHLENKGLLHRAPLYFKNSCEWQRRVRKHCFEVVRRCESFAGYDFLGPIDTHWHTFGYDVGMMNEFYELKPGESVRNVRMYNSDTVLLCDLDRKANFESGEKLSFSIITSCFGVDKINDGVLSIRLTCGGETIEHRRITVDGIEGGQVVKLCDVETALPIVEKPQEMKLYVALDAENVFAENEWELYLYPRVDITAPNGVEVIESATEDELASAMEEGKNVVIFGTEPFKSNIMYLRVALAGRPDGNLATVITDHPILRDLPHSGYCGWQFETLIDYGRAVVVEGEGVPYEPIIEVASTHKNAIKQSALFEFKMENGRFLVCSFNFKDDDAAGRWLKKQIFDYVSGDSEPAHEIDRAMLHSMVNYSMQSVDGNANIAFNPNAVTVSKKNKK